jgi:hypothetical protein
VTNVGGFDIAVDNAGTVSSFQRISDLDSEQQERLHLQRLAGDALLQGGAVEILHDDEGLVILFANVVDGANARVIQCGGSSRLALKTIQGVRVADELIRQKLDGDISLEADVLCLINHSHAAAAQFFQYPVMRDSPAHGRLSVFGLASQPLRGHFDGRSFQEPCCLLIGR